MKNGLTKQHSKMLYGIAILMMLLYHTFFSRERLDYDYFSVVDFLLGPGMENRIAWQGKLCVGIYAFITGYAMEKLSSAKTDAASLFGVSVGHLLSFLRKYWLVFAIFIPMGFFMGHFRELSLGTWVLGILGVSRPFNGEWWYVNFYLSAVLMFPLLVGVHRWALAAMADSHGRGLLAYSLAAAVFLYSMRRWGNELVNILILLEGYTFAHYGLFERIDRTLSPIPLRKLWLPLALAAMFALRWQLAREASYNQVDVLLVPPFVYAVCSLIRADGKTARFLGFFGRYSTYMWLTHSFFIYYYFPRFSLISGNDLIIALQLILVSLATAVCLSKLESFLVSLWKTRFKKTIF